MVAIIEKRDLRDFDWLTTLLAVSIACFGIWQIRNALPSESYWSKQIIGLGIALVAFLVVAFSDYRRIIDLAKYITEKDTGRPAEEVARLGQRYAIRYNDLLAYLDHFGGVVTRRFVQPKPQDKS